MAPPIKIIGNYVSPYVRKVLVCLHLKGLDYEIDPIVPFMGDDSFSRLSPLRRVPVLIDDQVTLSDSSVICQYLEDRYPEPALYPLDLVARARARWLEEYADTRMGEVIIWRLFYQIAVLPHALGGKTDAAVVERTLQHELPQVLDYLESELPEQGYACGDLSIADISIASFFRNAAFVRQRIDPARWPRSAAYVERVLAIDAFQKLKPFEDKSARTPVALQRDALAALGAPLMAHTCGDATARPGLMQI